jgi:hypothetical protein
MASKKKKTTSLAARDPSMRPAGAAMLAAPQASASTRAEVSVTGGFNLVDIIVEGFAIPLAWSTSQPNTAVGGRDIKIDGLISINLRCISSSAIIAKAKVKLGTKELTPIQVEMPAGDSGYVTFYRSL